VKGRMLAVALVGFLPALVLFLFVTAKQREFRIAEHENELRSFARVSAVEYGRLLHQGEALLGVLSEFPEVTEEGSACSRRLAAVMRHLEHFTTVSLIGLDGYLMCGALGDGTLYIGDRAYFRRALATNRFSMGEYAVGRITGKPIVGLAVPINTEDGVDVESVLSMSLDLDAVGNEASSMNIPVATTFTVLDGAGNVMVRVRDAAGFAADTVGSVAPDEFMAMITGVAGTVYGTDLDGVERAMAVEPLRGTGAGILGYLVVGGATDVLDEADDLARTELLILLAGLLFLGAVTYGLSRKLT